ncbi:MAG: DUF99 family protein [Nitrososphaerota archaeon]
MLQSRLRPGKKGIRALGIAESFRKDVGGRSILVGVVQRADLLIDGVVMGSCTVGGMDATDAIIRMWTELDRDDVNVILLSGCVISWFNIVELPRLHQQISTPIISLTYEESEGLTEVIKRRFPEDWMERDRIYKANGERTPITVKTGLRIYVRALGMDIRTCEEIVNRFLIQGRYPEPVRVAKIVARSALNLLNYGRLGDF